MKRWLWAVVLVATLSCSTQNREGVDATCSDLQFGAINACQDGIITSCKAGKVLYEVCPDKEACESTWQEPDAYRCSESEPPPDLEVPSSGGSSPSSGGSGSGGGGSGGTDDSGNGGQDIGGSGGSTEDNCSSASCLVATASDDIDVLTMDESRLYFGGCDTVYSVEKAGGPTTTLVNLEGGCQLGDIAVGGGDLFFVFDAVVYKVPSTGGAYETAIGDQSYVGNLAANNEFLLWIGNNTLNKLGTDGTSAPVSGSDPASENLQIAGGYAYWSKFTGFERLNIGADAIDTYVSTRPRTLRVVEGAAYILSSNAVSSVSLQTSQETTLGVASSEAGQITSNGSHVYWTEPDGVKALPVAGGDVHDFDSDPVDIRLNVGGIEADAEFVYWTGGEQLLKRSVL